MTSGEKSQFAFPVLRPRAYLPLTIVHWKEGLIKVESSIFFL